MQSITELILVRETGSKRIQQHLMTFIILIINIISLKLYKK